MTGSSNSAVRGEQFVVRRQHGLVHRAAVAACEDCVFVAVVLKFQKQKRQAAWLGVFV
jgi:hypothetical protein